MSALWKLMNVETRLFFRERQAVFWTFLFPVLMIWMFGEMFGNARIAGMSYSDAYVPSWIAVNLLTTSLFTIGTTLSSYRQTGIMRRFQATPIPMWVILASHLAYGTVIFIFSAVIMVTFGKLAFHLTWPKYWGSTLLALFISLLALFPFGLLMTSLAKNVRTVAAISSLLLNLMLFLSGATFPLEGMPHFLQLVARILPLYYVINLLQQVWNFSSITHHLTDVWVLLGIFVVSSILAPKAFRWSSSID